MTFMPLTEIEEFTAYKDQEINIVKKRLAWELTCIIHGSDAANKAQEAADSLFSAGGASDNMPTTVLLDTDLTDNTIHVTDLMVKCGLVPSKAEARRVIEQGGLLVNDVKVDSLTAVFDRSELTAGLVLRKGKKSFRKAVLGQ